MRLRTVEVKDFRRVRHAQVALTPGINLLYGPNDLGKSTIAEAIRAVFLVQGTSTDARKFVPWNSDRLPLVRVVFDAGDHTYQFTKTFGPKGTVELEQQTTLGKFASVSDGRRAEERVRELLEWGLPRLGGKGRQTNETWLALALLGRQDEAVRILDSKLGDDPTETGKLTITKALDALSQDPRVSGILQNLETRLALVYNEQGKLRRAEISPLVAKRNRILEAEKKLVELEAARTRSEAIETELLRLTRERDRLALLGEDAKRVFSEAKQAEESAMRHQALQATIDGRRKELDRINEMEADRATTRSRLEEVKRQLTDVTGLSSQLMLNVEAAEGSLAAAQSNHEALRLRYETEKIEQEQARVRRRLELDNAAAEAERTIREANECLSARRTAEVIEAEYSQAGAEADRQRVAFGEMLAAEGRVVHEVFSSQRAATVMAVDEGASRVEAAKARVQEMQGICQASEDALRAASDRKALVESENQLQRAQQRVLKIEREERDAKDWLRDALQARERIRIVDALTHDLCEARSECERLAAILADVTCELDGGDVLSAAASHDESNLLRLESPVPVERPSLVMPILVAILIGGTTGAFVYFTTYDSRMSALVALLASLLTSLIGWRVVGGRVARRRKQALELERSKLEDGVRDHGRIVDRLQQDLDRTPAVVPPGFEGDPVKDQPVWEQKRLGAAAERRDLEATLETLDAAIDQEQRRVGERIERAQASCDYAAVQLRNAQENSSQAREDLARSQAVLDSLQPPMTASVDSGSMPSWASAALIQQQKQLQTAVARVAQLQARFEQARMQAEERSTALSLGAEELLRLATVEKSRVEQERVATNLPATISSVLAEQVDTAARTLETNEERLACARRANDKTKSDRDHLEREFERLSGQQDMMEKSLAATNRAECERLLHEEEQQRAALPAGKALTISSSEAEREVYEADDRLHRIEAQLNSQKGQLRLIGGAVVGEQCAMAREAVERERAELERLEQEMEALRLLRDVIVEQDDVRASNLGAVLAKPLTERLNNMARSRYGPIILESDLTANVIVAGGEKRAIADLSVGTKEQISTLLKLVVASQLKTALLLDDQLVQSDPARIGWFLEEFRRCAAAGTQIIILTCRPSDYLPGLSAGIGEESNAVTVVDLAACILSDELLDA